jgi:hypothetical protein
LLVLMWRKTMPELSYVQWLVAGAVCYHGITLYQWELRVCKAGCHYHYCNEQTYCKKCLFHFIAFNGLAYLCLRVTV